MKKRDFLSVLLMMAVCSGSCIIGSCSKNDIEENAPAENGSSSADLSGTTNGHEWVDLGLPSGTRWATCNVGASAPEEYGDYFAWGETEGRNSGKTTFSWSTYKLAGESGYDGYQDAATESWGGSWQTPSMAQIAELIDGTNCNTVWTTLNGVNGRMIISKRNGKQIFLPAAGHCLDTNLGEAGTEGYYWSRSISVGYPGSASSLFFSAGHPVLMNYYYRYVGRTIRPVRK